MENKEIEREKRRIKEFRWVLDSVFNANGHWIISSREMAIELRKLSVFEGFDKSVPQYITNSFQHMQKNGEAYKLDGKPEYFAIIKYSYPILDMNQEIIDAKNSIEVPSSIIETIKKIKDIKSNDFFANESLFSTIIENSTLTERNIEERSKNPFDFEIIEKTNIEDTYKYFIENKIKDDIDDAFLKQLHSRLFRGLGGSKRIENINIVGKYTEKQNFIKGGFIPCKLEHKLSELSKFIDFFNSKPKNLEEAIISAAIVSYWFAGIHIFSDGNSRTGRFLLSYYMFKHGFTNSLSFAVSKSMRNIGGKPTFVQEQGISWSENSINNYIHWFIFDLLESSWTLTMDKYLKGKI